MALLIEAGQMTASDYVPTYPDLLLASDGASTDAMAQTTCFPVNTVPIPTGSRIGNAGGFPKSVALVEMRRDWLSALIASDGAITEVVANTSYGSQTGKDGILGQRPGGSAGRRIQLPSAERERPGRGSSAT